MYRYPISTVGVACLYSVGLHCHDFVICMINNQDEDMDPFEIRHGPVICMILHLSNIIDIKSGINSFIK